MSAFVIRAGAVALMVSGAGLHLSGTVSIEVAIYATTMACFGYPVAREVDDSH